MSDHVVAFPEKFPQDHYGKVKVNIDLYSASSWNLTSNALRCGSHSVNCQSHHTCIYP